MYPQYCAIKNSLEGTSTQLFEDFISGFRVWKLKKKSEEASKKFFFGITFSIHKYVSSLVFEGRYLVFLGLNQILWSELHCSLRWIFLCLLNLTTQKYQILINSKELQNPMVWGQLAINSIWFDKLEGWPYPQSIR